MNFTVEELYGLLRDRPVFEILERSPQWLAAWLAKKKETQGHMEHAGKSPRAPVWQDRCGIASALPGAAERNRN